MATKSFDKESIKQSILGKLQRYNGKTLEEANNQQIYNAVASTVRDQIMQRWVEYRERDRAYQGKRLYYMSIEFLVGRSLYSNVLNLCATTEYTQALTELGIAWQEIMPSEPEPGLGNYVWFFSRPVNLAVFQRTFVVAGWVTVLCVVLAYPYAWLMTSISAFIVIAELAIDPDDAFLVAIWRPVEIGLGVVISGFFAFSVFPNFIGNSLALETGAVFDELEHLVALVRDAADDDRNILPKLP